MIVLGTVLVFARAIVYSGESLSINGQPQASMSLAYGIFLMLVFGIIAAVSAAWRVL